jgi:metallopeptidase family M12-like protein
MTMRAGVSALVASLLLSLLPVAESLAAPSPPPLFDAAAPSAPTAPSAASSRATVRQRPVTSRLDLLTHPDGSPALGAGDRVQLNLFDDARFTMIVTDVTRHGRYGLTWSGTLDGVDLGSATLAVHEGALVGHVSMPAATYRIAYAADGTPVIEEIDQAALPPDAPSVIPPGSGVMARDVETRDEALDTGPTIDVMVLYTAAARAAAGGTTAMRLEVSLAVAKANEAYANSGLDQRVRLVFSGETSIVESGSISTDLDHISNDPTVAWLRDAARADLVSLITSTPNPAFCGIAYLMTGNSAAFAPLAFSVVERVCATANLSLPHEFGHNMGTQHDAFVSVGQAVLFPYSHGYVDLVGKFRTVMAYPDQCLAAGFSCTRIPYFSTPGKTFNGRTLGNALTADSARTLSETANTVAGFRQPVASPLTLATAVNQPAFAVGETLVASVSVSHPGAVAGNADFYAGFLLPDGRAVFFTSLTMTPTSGYAFGTIANFGSYRPLATGVPLGAPFAVNVPTFLAYARAAGDPTGGLVFFVLVLKSGALADGVLAADEVLAASLTPFTFPP